MDDDEVAGVHAERGGLVSVCIGVAETSGAVWFTEVHYGEVDFKDAIFAAQVCWFEYGAAGMGALADVLGRLLGFQGRGKKCCR